MHHNWIKGLSEEETKAIKREYKQALLLRERLESLLEDKIEQSLKEMRDVVKKGDVVHLTEYYADELSRQATLADIIKLIKE